MKTVSVRSLQKRVKECIDDSQQQRVIITRHGKPAAVLFGLEGEDWESVVLETDPEFWRRIQERRAQVAIPFGEMEKRLEAGE